MMNSQGEWGPVWAVRRVIFQQYFKLSGRATRTEYWWFLIAYIGVALTMGVVVGLLSRAFQFPAEPVALVLSCVMALGCLPALLALWVRRCRDLGRLNVEAIVSFFFGVLSLDFLTVGLRRRLLRNTCVIWENV
jgi:uncharacterized membrane protein YhaH (DUF805 family)